MSSKKRTAEHALLSPNFGKGTKKSILDINTQPTIKTEQNSSGDSIVNDEFDTTITVVEKPITKPRSAGKKPVKKKKNSNPIIIAENPVILAENPVVVTVTEKPIINNEKPIQSVNSNVNTNMETNTTNMGTNSATNMGTNTTNMGANTSTNMGINSATNMGTNSATNMGTNMGTHMNNMPPPNQAQLSQLKKIKEQLVPDPNLNDIYRQIIKLRLQDHQNLKALFMMTNTIMNDVKSLKKYTHLLNVDRKHNMTVSELMDLCDTLNGDSEEIMVNWFTSLFRDRPDSFRDLVNLMNCAMTAEQKSILEQKKIFNEKDPFSVLSDTTDIVAQNMALDYEIFCNNNN